MEDVILLEASMHQDSFHYNINDDAIRSGHGTKCDDWMPLGIVTYSFADDFTRYVRRKYPEHIPDMDLLRSEFNAFRR